MRQSERKTRIITWAYIECLECYGSGELEIETPVVDWSHGGYIKSRTVECHDCGGSGLIEVEPEEEE